MNANTERQNAPGIDLIDREKKIAIQVSVTCDPKHIREKIRHSIKGIDVKEDDNWQFYFVPITYEAPKLGKDFELPEGLVFDKQNDVLDITRIMQLVQGAGIDIQKNLSSLVSKYDKPETGHREQGIPKCLTDYVPPRPEIELVGREDVVKAVRAMLDHSACVALVSGLGTVEK